jgi:Acyl CoA:acetate/3-ketoacid CoA transferase, beta subunit
MGIQLLLDNGFALSGPKRGRVKTGFLGAVQVDKYGNINTTQIGPIDNPKFRIAGNGGAVDIGCYCPHTFVICAQSKRTFVDQVGYVTTPGWVVPDNTKGERKWVRRETLGLTGGPAAIITNLGIMKFDEKTK